MLFQTIGLLFRWSFSRFCRFAGNPDQRWVGGDHGGKCLTLVFGLPIGKQMIDLAYPPSLWMHRS